MKETVTKFKLPKTLAACVDRLYEIRQLRLAEDKKIDVLREEERALEDHLIDQLPKSEASGIAGRVARATIMVKSVPDVQDWDQLYKYVSRTKSFDLLQRRVSVEAVKARWEAGKEVPGIGVFRAVKVSLNKLA